MDTINGGNSEKIETEFKLTEQHIQELHTAFCCFDQGDGTIPNRRLGEVLRALGQNPTDVEIQEIINDYDNDNDGNMDFHEFLKIMKLKFQQSDSESELRHAFRVFDSEEKGWMSIDEVKYVMMYLDDKLTEAETDAMLCEVVGNGACERLEYEQFVELIDMKERKKNAHGKQARSKNRAEDVEPGVWFADV